MGVQKQVKDNAEDVNDFLKVKIKLGIPLSNTVWV